MIAIERDLFNEIRNFAAAQGTRIRATAGAVAELDVTAALAQVAADGRLHTPPILFR